MTKERDFEAWIKSGLKYIDFEAFVDTEVVSRKRRGVMRLEKELTPLYDHLNKSHWPETFKLGTLLTQPKAETFIRNYFGYEPIGNGFYKKLPDKGKVLHFRKGDPGIAKFAARLKRNLERIGR